MKEKFQIGDRVKGLRTHTGKHGVVKAIYHSMSAVQWQGEDVAITIGNYMLEKINSTERGNK